ncbi:uncharacterized protein KY384_006867 [Bacidia gigantensis]|uniref:uncharacterized protein n=1 Tax=Bacidia gigantensis TaxID=2732470 RepID=UPI001D03C156|nr:uncharacterized protein KY384_006867 [Bacidia gigantensis]KAG8527951.1 hypothetical protein KY384_006867 [Bacidia gigantensis]
MADPKIYRASTTAPVNIAVIKYSRSPSFAQLIHYRDTDCQTYRYWGKRDPRLNLPTNSSLSVTLSQRDLRTHTTASCSSTYAGPDSLLLNGADQSLETPRSIACLKSLRSLRAELEANNTSLPTLSTLPLRIVSKNNFPTAAGLASSAAGFAALIRAIANLYELPQPPEDLSLIARQGSGSACRSLLGGYVAWDVGHADDGSDSKARIVASKEHWPEMRALILVVSAEKKAVSSTAGMQATVATSELFKARVQVVPGRMKEMEDAIKRKDFAKFARLTMKDSNNFHACCLDTEPPIRYTNDVSWAAMQVVEDMNKTSSEGDVAAYTFDAGPNAVIYYTTDNRSVVEGRFDGVLTGKEGWVSSGNGLKREPNHADETLRNGISRVIMTSVGDGPVNIQDHLINEKGEASESTT